MTNLWPVVIDSVVVVAIGSVVVDADEGEVVPGPSDGGAVVLVVVAGVAVAQAAATKAIAISIELRRIPQPYGQFGFSGDRGSVYLLSRAAINAGRTLWTSPTTPKSAIEKIGASGSLLMAMIVVLSFMPTTCCIAPEMPAAM